MIFYKNSYLQTVQTALHNANTNKLAIQVLCLHVMDPTQSYVTKKTSGWEAEGISIFNSFLKNSLLKETNYLFLLYEGNQFKPMLRIQNCLPFLLLYNIRK